MQIPRDFIDELLTRTDITELVSGYVSLKKSGSNTKGLCPFHTEKTPSFTVNSDLQIFKCFGCGKGGNAITFFMEIENLPFTDAVEILAKRAGMTIPQENDRSGQTSRRRRILELNREAAKHFHKMLTTTMGQAARDYLAGRGISKISVTRFGIGAAPNDWTLLLEAMTKKGFTKQELIDAGLCKRGKSGDSAYDFFRDRLMFPIIDVKGEVIAFSGRTLSDENKGFKYLNTPDTIAFNKGKNLFGLNLARKSKAGMIILVEGNFGVVTLHQAGFDCAAAQLGSAFTPQQARLLAHYTDNIVLCFDADEAGRKATLKALPLIEATGKNVKVVDLGQGDPDDYIRQHGADAFRVLIGQGENHAQYRMQRILSNNDLSTDEGRLAYLSAVTQYLAQIDNLPEREIYSMQAAKTAGVSPEAVKNEINRILRKRKRGMGYKPLNSAGNSRNTTNRPKETVQPASRELRYSVEASAVAEEGVIRCLLKDITLMSIVREMGFEDSEFTSDFLAKVFRAVDSRLRDDTDVTPALIMGQLETSEASHLTNILEKPERLSGSVRAIREYINKIRTERYKQMTPGEDMLREIAELKKKTEEGGISNG